jgi:dipeptidyl aminopeptidase/acylaminoacyl peptidase
LLVLPAGHQQGKRYPLVTWLYPGWMVTDTSYVPFLYDKQSVSSLNLVPLISRGVGLLIPSLPLPPDGETADPYLELPKGVMPAVDRAIELGFADPDRLALMGHSFGGYATFSLVSYTHRFKAAFAMAGPSNLVSKYGEYFPGQRYYDYAHEELFGPALAESGQTRMGRPPWGDLFRYMRNSPISFADRVQTPLMIIQGDMDYVSLQQGEEFFNAMYRLGKEAHFVRYWGEGHVIDSPANIRDLWQRIFAWLDQHLQINQEK